MPRARIQRLATLSGLYTTQGITSGFLGFVLIPRLSEQGVSLEVQGGILSLAAVPWVIKLGWAPLLDRARSPRGIGLRGWLFGAMVGVALTVGLMAMIPKVEANTGWLAATWLLHNLLLSFQDVTTDAVCLDAVPPGERGRANAAMLGGGQLGQLAIGSLLLGWVVSAAGIDAALWVHAGIVAALSAAVFVWPNERATAVTPRPPLRPLLRELMGRRTVALGALLALTGLFADQLTSAASGHFLVQAAGWSAEEISTWFPFIVVIPTLVGYYVVAGVFADRAGHARAAAMTMAVLGAMWLGFSVVRPLWQSHGFMAGWVGVQAVVTAAMYAAIHALLMDVTDPRVRATHFALMMALINLSRVAAGATAGPIVGALGFVGTYAVCGGWQILAAGIAWRLVVVGEDDDDVPVA